MTDHKPWKPAKQHFESKAFEDGLFVYWFNLRHKIYLPIRAAEGLFKEPDQEHISHQPVTPLTPCLPIVDKSEEPEESAFTQPEEADAETASMPSSGAELNESSKEMEYVAITNFLDLMSNLNKLEACSTTDGDKQARLASLKEAYRLGAYRPLRIEPDWLNRVTLLAQEFPSFKAAVELIVQAYSIAQATKQPPRLRPILLVGSPGIGKSHFCQELAKALKMRMRWIAIDGPSMGAQLRGLDKYWSNSTPGVLFELIAASESAEPPMVVIDEIDKASRNFGRDGLDVLAQLYSCLEPQTASRITDLCTDIEMDTSYVAYIATANTLSTLDPPLLSRFEVVHVELPKPEERRMSTQRIIEKTIERMGASPLVKPAAGCTVVLENYSPRVIARTIEKAVGSAIAVSRRKITSEDVEAALGTTSPTKSNSRSPHTH